MQLNSEAICTRCKDNHDIEVILTLGILLSSLTLREWCVESLLECCNFQNKGKKKSISADLELIKIISSLTESKLNVSEPDTSYFSIQPKHLPKSKDSLQFTIENTSPYHIHFFEMLLMLLSPKTSYTQIELTMEKNITHFLNIDKFQFLTLPFLRKLGMDADITLNEDENNIICNLDIEPSKWQIDEENERGDLLSSNIIIHTSPENEKRGRIIFTKIKDRLEIEGISPRLQIIENSAIQDLLIVSVNLTYENGVGGFTTNITNSLTPLNKEINQLLKWIEEGCLYPQHYDWLSLIPIILSDASTKFYVTEINDSLLTSSFIIKQFIPVYLTIIGKPGDRGQIIIR